MNLVVLHGRLTKDPKVEEKSGTMVCKFSVAVPRKFKENEADFINCVAFNKTATFIGSYFAKGSEICLDGSIRTSSYETEKGKQFKTEIAVSSVEFCGKRSDNAKPTNEDFEELESIDEELPF